MDERSADVFHNVRVRYFVFLWLIGIFYLPGADFLFGVMGLSLPWYGWYMAYAIYSQVLLALVLALTIHAPVRLPIAKMLGPTPSSTEMRSGLTLVVFLFILAWAMVYVLFLPLSYVVPRFVEYWLIDLPDLIFYDAGVYPAGANLLQLISLCVVAPIIEEVAFRGVVLHRWAYRYGLRRAVIGSSLVFAIVHPDFLGAFFFGVGMCALYLRSQSLVLPIVCHGIYNFVVWSVELGYVVYEGPDVSYTLERFQAEWIGGVVALVIVVLWSVFHVRRQKTDIRWKLPVT